MREVHTCPKSVPQMGHVGSRQLGPFLVTASGSGLACNCFIETFHGLMDEQCCTLMHIRRGLENHNLPKDTLRMY